MTTKHIVALAIASLLFAWFTERDEFGDVFFVIFLAMLAIGAVAILEKARYAKSVLTGVLD